MDTRYINVALGILSISICLILIAYLLFTNKRTKSDKWMMAILVSNTLMILGDVIDRGLGGIPGRLNHFAQLFGAVIVYYTASGILLLSIVGWLISIISQRRVLSKWWIRVGCMLTAIQILLSVTMPWTKICYIDASNVYHRGDLFILTQIFPYIVYIMGMYVLFRYYKAFSFKERIYMGVFVSVPVIAEIFQVINNDILLMNVVLTVGLVMVMMFIQSQREIEREEQLKAILLREKEKLEDMSERQESLNSQLIDVLCGAVEAKDLYTRGHSMRVAQYAREIMYRLGGDEKAQQEVYCIGILHDVGKISIPDEIINKKGRLTEEEYHQIQMHTISGYQILRGVDLIPGLAIGARWHHERYDGKGYPNGLEGENIPLIARIISVADAYDAMTSNRSYHSVMPQSDVREQIVKGMGTQFDPKIAQIMLDMIDEDLQYDMRQINYNRITNVLLIDDDAFVHDLIEQVLGGENYVVTYASSGLEGIDLLKQNKYDLCLLDMEMPGMNGFEVLAWIRSNVRKTKVIFLTGDKNLETIQKCEKLGIADYVTKPINSKFLVESIKNVLSH